MQEIIRCHKVSKYHGSESNILLPAMSFSIRTSEMVAITGPSGCGKSTLLNILGLIDNHSSGEYFLYQQEVSLLTSRQQQELRKSIFSHIFQQYNLIDHLNVLDNVALPLRYRKTSKDQYNAQDMLDLVGLSDFGYRFPNQLSGGQQQRVSIARALITKPKILLADEPTGALDPDSTRSIMSLLSKMHQSMGTTVVLVTHDAWIAEQCQRNIKFTQLCEEVV